MNRQPQIEFVEMPEHLKPKYQYYTCAPMDTLRSAGYSAPVTPLADAVKDYVQNYLMKDESRA
jgi:ADP-L-glycero-D-manno-heptose 6-epimerase